MSLYTTLKAVADWIGAQLPDRSATLDLRDFGARRDDDWMRGFVTVYSDGIADFTHYMNEAPKYGTVKVKLLWQGCVEDGEDRAERVAILESAFIDEAMTLFQRVDWPVQMVECKSLATSALVEAPYAWILFDLEIRL